MLNTFELCPLHVTHTTGRPEKCTELCAWNISGCCAMVETATALNGIVKKLSELVDSLDAWSAYNADRRPDHGEDH